MADEGDPLDIPAFLHFRADLLQAIGAVVVTFQSLETQLDGMIWALIGVATKEKGKAITANLSFRAKYEMLANLVLKVSSVDEVGWRALYKRFEPIGNRRRNAVHGIWLDSETESPRAVFERGRGIDLVKSMSVDDLHTLARDLETLTDDLWEFIRPLAFSSPDTQL